MHIAHNRVTFSKSRNFYIIVGVDLEFFSFSKNSLLAHLLALIPNPFAVFRFVARFSRNRGPNLENLRFFTIFLTHYNFLHITNKCGPLVFKMIFPLRWF